ncbi:MAG TPA: Wzz/FepE/Etk N-terminal domain-containing protein, partial [Stenomitos sp.]
MEETEGSIDLRQYWLIVRRRWLPATLVTLGTIGLTVGVTALQTPIYQPEGLVLLKKDSGLTPSSSLDSASGSTAGVLESLTSQSNPASTEIAIITSDPLLLKTIRALNLRWQPSILQTLRIMPSPPTDELRPVDFLKNLTVTNVKDTDVISIQYKNADPKLATKVVNTLMSFYKARNLESNREEATAARKFVETQLPKAEQDVRRYAEALRIFKERSKVVSIPAEQQGAVTALGTLQTSLTDLQGKLAEANTRSQSLRNQVGLSPKQALQVNALSQSPAVQKALTDLQDVQRLLATARTQFQSNHPQIRDLEERQTALSSFLGTQVNQVIGLSTSASSPTQLNTVQAGQTQQSLSESLAQAEVQRMGLQNQVDSLSKSRLEYLQNMSKLPRLEEIDRDLERQLGVA